MEKRLAVIGGNPSYVVKVYMTDHTYLTGCTRFVFNPEDETVSLLNDFHQPFHIIDMKVPQFLKIEIFDPKQSQRTPKQLYIRKPRRIG